MSIFSSATSSREDANKLRWHFETHGHRHPFFGMRQAHGFYSPFYYFLLDIIIDTEFLKRYNITIKNE